MSDQTQAPGSSMVARPRCLPRRMGLPLPDLSAGRTWLIDPDALGMVLSPGPCRLGLTYLSDPFFEVYLKQPIHLTSPPK